MSSSDEDDVHQSTTNAGAVNGADGTKRKRRKVMRACDFCRYRKIKCDAPSKNVGGQCTACVAHSKECTFVERARKRGPPKGYMEFLEGRLDQLENVLQKLAPTFNINDELGPRYTPTSWVETDQYNKPATRTPRNSAAVKSKQPSPPSVAMQTSGGLPVMSPIAHPGVSLSYRSGSNSPAIIQAPNDIDSQESSEDENYLPSEFMSMVGVDHKVEDDLAARFSQLGLQKGPFFGKSSGLRLIERARAMMSEITGRSTISFSTISPDRRAAFWERKHPWLSLPSGVDDYAKTLLFPPDDLLNALIALYFRYFHPIFPTLDLSMLEGQMKQNLHKRNLSFGLQVLLVCAVGSRWSEDPRVCIGWDPNVPSDTIDWHIAGWPFIEQIFGVPNPFRQTTRLHDLQNTVLLTFYLQATQAAHSMWFVAGAGLRMAMDLGAHRRKAYRNDGSLEDELWKRTFWCLVNIDRMTSIVLGRPLALNDEDIDADFPLDVDNPSRDRSNKQPNGQASLIQGLNRLTILLQITSFAVRTIYSNKRSKARPGFLRDEWEQHIVSELDSSLNNWIDDMPSHLRWDPNIADPIIFEQSVILNLYYRQAQIIIHRPFLPGLSKKHSPLSYSSLAICSNAARSVSHILDAHRNRRIASMSSMVPLEGSCTTMTATIGIGFLAGVVLLMVLWDSKKSGTAIDTTSLADDAQKIANYIKFAESRLGSAGKLWDTFQDLTSSCNLSEGPTKRTPTERSSQKRRQPEDRNKPEGDAIPSETSFLAPAASTVPSIYNDTTAPSISSWTQPQVYGIPVWTNSNSFVTGRNQMSVDLYSVARAQAPDDHYPPAASNPQAHPPRIPWLSRPSMGEHIGTRATPTMPTDPRATKPLAPPFLGLTPGSITRPDHQVTVPPNTLAIPDNLSSDTPERIHVHPATPQTGVFSTSFGDLLSDLGSGNPSRLAEPITSVPQGTAFVHPPLGGGGSMHSYYQDLDTSEFLTSYSNIVGVSNNAQEDNSGGQYPDTWGGSSSYDFATWLADDWNPFGNSVGSQSQNYHPQ